MSRPRAPPCAFEALSQPLSWSGAPNFIAPKNLAFQHIDVSLLEGAFAAHLVFVFSCLSTRLTVCVFFFYRLIYFPSSPQPTPKTKFSKNHPPPLSEFIFSVHLISSTPTSPTYHHRVYLPHTYRPSRIFLTPYPLISLHTHTISSLSAYCVLPKYLITIEMRFLFKLCCDPPESVRW